MEAIAIPHFIDNPHQIAFWEADEIGPVMALFGLGIITGTLTYCLLAAYGVHKVFMHFKDKHLRGYLMHWFYRAGITRLNRRFPNGAIHHYEV